MNTLRLSDRLERLKPGVSTAPQNAPELESSNNELNDLRTWTKQQTQSGVSLTTVESEPIPHLPPIPDFDILLGDKRLLGFDIRRAVFLDIETTGLSHGAGTLAFLIGMAYVKDDSLVFEQIFLDDPANELPALEYFLEVLNAHDFLVSFNGKSFDLSILQSRLVMTRLMTRSETELKVRPHLDLLHTARQVYKGVFENTRLQTLEQHVLGIDPNERANDIPGTLVPTMYFHYLQTGQSSQLDVVLKHNRTDVLSLVHLTIHLARIFECPPSDVDVGVLVNLGRAALRRKLNFRAIVLLERALKRLCIDEHHSVLVDLVAAYRRNGDFSGAHNAAQRALATAPRWDVAERDRLDRQITRYAKKAERLAKPRN